MSKFNWHRLNHNYKPRHHHSDDYDANWFNVLYDRLHYDLRKLANYDSGDVDDADTGPPDIHESRAVESTNDRYAIEHPHGNWHVEPTEDDSADHDALD